MLTEQTICKLDPTFDASGKLMRSVHVDVASVIARDGVEIGRQSHRYVVNVATMDMTHMVSPMVSHDERQRLATILQAMVESYGVAEINGG